MNINMSINILRLLEEHQHPNNFETASVYDIEEDEFYLLGITIAVSILSLLGSLFIMFSYFAFKSIRNLAFKLVFQLAFADLICTVGNLLTIDRYFTEEANATCYAQAVLTNYGELSSIFWTMVIAFSIYSAVVRESKDIAKHMIYYRLFAFGLPVIFTLIPIFTNQFGPAGAWCWIKEDAETSKSKTIAMRLIQFYIPLWIAFIFNTYAICRVSHKMRYVLESSFEKRFAQRLQLYPVILLICWFFATINRLYNISGKESAFLNVMHMGMGGLQGFFNAIAYGATTTVKQAYINGCGRCCPSWSVKKIQAHDTVNLKEDGANKKKRGNQNTNDDDNQSELENQMRQIELPPVDNKV